MRFDFHCLPCLLRCFQGCCRCRFASARISEARIQLLAVVRSRQTSEFRPASGLLGRSAGETNILLAKFIRPAYIFLLHLGYCGPVLMGVLDSSFLFLPFGNDLLVVTLVARNHKGAPWYTLAAALGSTIGVFVLALVARRLGEEGIKKMAGPKRFNKLSRMIDKHGGKAIVLACIAPPPFPFTMVIAAAAALDFSWFRICAINFFTRGVRFAILGLLAVKYGRHILELANSNAFRVSMFVFIALCIAGSAFSIYQWLKNVRSGKKTSRQL